MTVDSKSMKTVFVGLSGGVDSAVSAYLLKKEGYRVVGVFLKAWEPDFLPCTGARDRLEAMRVAAYLEIPFMTYDMAEEYKREVVDYFVEEYRQGRTPNPDVLCNRAIKFGAFWDRAKKDGADFIATGHYAQVKKVEGRRWKVEGKKPRASAFNLLTSRDSEKDQTYFLWTLAQDDLAHALFPVGHLHKNEVRRIAKEAGLPNAERKDSQGLCFLGHVDMEAFLKHYLPLKKGDVVDEKGQVVGEHDGAWFYTLGQHLPLSVGKKLYVVSKDMQKNKLTATSKMIDVGRQSFELVRTNWIREAPESGRGYEAEVRYHGERHAASILGDRVTFDTPVLAAEGQSLVVYNSATEECIGGGIITEGRK